MCSVSSAITPACATAETTTGSRPLARDAVEPQDSGQQLELAPSERLLADPPDHAVARPHPRSVASRGRGSISTHTDSAVRERRSSLEAGSRRAAPAPTCLRAGAQQVRAGANRDQ